jgi:GH15 family glucan-1,4-alpha-glucosidase
VHFLAGGQLCLHGRLSDAQALFERLLGLRNHLGLLSEEYDSKLRRLISNFPQAFSHLALIMTAHNIDLASKGQLAA